MAAQVVISSFPVLMRGPRNTEAVGALRIADIVSARQVPASGGTVVLGSTSRLPRASEHDACLVVLHDEDQRPRSSDPFACIHEKQRLVKQLSSTHTTAVTLLA